MAKTIRGLSIEIGGDTSKLGQALKNVNETARGFNKELKDIDKSLKLDPKNVELLAQKQEVLTKAIQNTSEKLEVLKKGQEEARKEFEKGNMSEEQYRKIQREVIKTEQELGKMKTQLKEINKIDFEKLGKNLKDVGGKMSKYVTAPIMAMAGASVKFAMDFEQSMAKVKTIADTTQKPIKEISDEILDLSNRTGVASTELAESVYQAISAGVGTADAVKIVEIATKSAVAGFTDTTTAVDGLTTVINSYGLSMEEADGLANKFLVTQNLGKTTFGELASSIGKVSPIASTLNVTTDELLSSLASLTANGIATSEAVTSLKAAYSNIIKPTADAKKISKELGLEFDSNAIKTKGWAGFLEDLKNKTGGNVDTMAKLFGSTEAVNTILSLTSDNGMALLNKSMVEMGENTTALDEAFNTMQETTQSKLNKALQGLKNSAIDLGGALLPIAQKLIDGISGLVNWFNKLDGSQKVMVATIGLVVAAIGPLLSLLGNLSLAFGASLGPIGLLVAGLGLVAGGITALVTASKDGSKSFNKMMDDIETSDEKLDKVNKKFEEMEQTTNESMKKISDDFVATLNEIAKATEDSNLTELWNQLLQSYENILDERKKGIRAKYEEINNIILSSAMSEEQKAKLIEESNKKEALDLDNLQETYDRVYAKITEIVGANGENIKNLSGAQQVELNNLKNELAGITNISQFETGNTETAMSEATKKILDTIAKKIQDGKNVSSKEWDKLKNAMLEDSKEALEAVREQIATNQKLYDWNIIPKDQYETEKKILKELEKSLSSGISTTVNDVAKTVSETIRKAKGNFLVTDQVYTLEDKKREQENAKSHLKDLSSVIKISINDLTKETTGAWKEYTKGTLDSAKKGADIADIKSAMTNTGKNAYSGFVQGNPSSKYYNKGFTDAKEYNKGFKKGLDAKSRSKETEKSGKFALEGFLRGNNSKKYLEEGIKNAKAYTEAFNSSLSSFGNLNQSITNISPTPEKTFNLHVGTLINNTDKDTEALANDINFLIRRDNLK
jgi:TP901 family phage tail tape measure protein